MRRISPIPLSIVTLLLTALPVRAEVRVQGPVQDIRLEASHATVADILAALRAHFPIDVHGSPADRLVTGTYRGPLRLILARVLEGYDYVIRTNGPALDVLVLSSGAPREAAPAVVVRRRAD